MASSKECNVFRGFSAIHPHKCVCGKQKSEHKGETRKVYGNQAYRLQETCIANIKEAYSYGRSFHLTHEQILARLQERVWEPAKRLGAAEYAHLRGYSRCMLDNVYRDLVWLMSCDGKLMTRQEIDELTKVETLSGESGKKEYKSPWARIDSEKSAHVWKGADGKPLKDKPFSAGKKDDPATSEVEVRQPSGRGSFSV